MDRKLSILTLMVLMTFVIGASGATAHGTVAPVGPSSPAAALGTEFTYQGYLTDGDSPASGTFDFEFELYDDPDIGEGILLGTVIVGDEPVTDGQFTVELDFGDVFDGTALYLEIGVRPGSSSDAYTTLSPRQALTPTPYAIYAMNAPWSGLTNVPAGFADGTDDNTAYTAGEGLALNGRQFSAQGSSYGNVVVVAKSGGDYTSVQAAIDSVTGATANNPYLVWVAPGVYTETVTMKPYVHLQGAGQEATVITHEVTNTSIIPYNATVKLDSHTSLRDLTVSNYGTGNSNAALNTGSGTWNVLLSNVTVKVQGSGTYNYGIFAYCSSCALSLQNTTVLVENADYSYGLYNWGADWTIKYTTITANGELNTWGIYNTDNTSSLEADSLSVSGEGGSSTNYGLYNTGNADADIAHSVLTGATNSVYKANGDVTVSYSRLVGGSDWGSVTCVAVSRNNIFGAQPAHEDTNMKTAIIIITLFSLSILAMGAIAYSGYVISWFTIDGGGGESAGGMYTLSGTLGQPEAGPRMSGGDYTLSGGFWGGAATSVPYIYLPLIQR